MKPAMKVFVCLILAVGVIRFALTIAGLSDDVVKYASMTVVILAGAVYFAVAGRTHKERLKDAYLLILPYMAIEVAALGFTWATGVQTIFHVSEYSFGMSIGYHTLGHLVGGLTWEPLGLFVVMEAVWAVYTGGGALVRAVR